LGRYRVATIFVDHHSRLGYVHLQKDSTSKETLKAKHAFELYAMERGVKVKNYHADNGRFVDNAWKEGLAQENQGITHCGVNVHWQNGITERRIRDLKEQTRTMMLHAQHHWPDAVATSLWPYAMRTASHVFNDAPTLQGDHKDRTPREIFTGVQISAEVRHHHTFGCPVYVTEISLQQGKSLSVWMSRARVGINLGISPTHARSVALVLSLKTGLVLPQFHVKHDDLFETARTSLGGFRLPKSHWQELSGFEKPTKSVQREPRGSGTEFEGSARNAGARVPGGMGPDDHTDELPGDDEDRLPDDGGEAMGVESGGQYQGSQENAGSEQRADEAGGADVPTDNNRYGATTRSGRRVRIPARLRESRDQARGRKWVAWIANALQPPKLSPEDEIYEVLANQEYNVQDRASDPISFSATSDLDTMYWHQAMQQPDKAEFLKAAEAEVKPHVDNEHFVLMEQSSLPRGTKVLASVWSMKRKRRILSRKIYKWKARLNCHGGQQEHGITFWETYSPVVNWFLVRCWRESSMQSL
jgi:hypothetical protein